MATDTTSGGSVADTPKDPVREQIEAATARVEARRKLTAARLGAAAALGPGSQDGPTNTVTFGAAAGSLAPWLVHASVSATATTIAAAARAALDADTTQDADHLPCHVTFVTDDHDLLATDVESRQVLDMLTDCVAGVRDTTVHLVQVTARLREARLALRPQAPRRDDSEHTDAHPPLAELEALRADKDLEAVAPTDPAAPAADDKTPGAAATDTEPSTSTETGTVGSTLAAAVDLVKLLAVDYTVAAADVTTDSALMARLVAGGLGARRGGQVLLDGYHLTDSSPTLRTHRLLLAAVRALERTIRALTAELAPVTDQAQVLATRTSTAQEAWVTATTAPRGTDKDKDKDIPQAALDALKADWERLERNHLALVAAAAPGTRALAAAGELVEQVHTALATLLTPGGSGTSAIQRACSRDRLREPTAASTAPVTHVLLVQATHAGADIVTRRSIAGASGRVAYLAGTNGAWVLARRDGSVIGGGGAEDSRQLTHDLASGESMSGGLKKVQKWTSTDPLATSELFMRWAVLGIAAALVLLSLAAVWAVFFQG